MKKQFLLLLFLTFLLLQPATAQTFEYSYNGGPSLSYMVVDKTYKTCKLMSSSVSESFAGDLNLPSYPKNGNEMYTLVEINESAFSGNTRLTSIVIPKTVKVIGTRAFNSCTNLKSVTIGNSVSDIRAYAFTSCRSLISVKIPKSVKVIDSGAFDSCYGLTKAEFESIESLCSIKFDSPAANPLSYAHHLYINGKEITELEIPESIEAIGDFTFSGCTGLTGSLVIPEWVTSIGKFAFSSCTGFTGSLIIPDNVTSIGIGAFYDCSGFNGDLKISNGVSYIEERTFSDCSNLTGSLIIPKSITSIDSFAFKMCSNLTGPLIIPESVVSISDEVFYGCSGLTSIMLEEGIKSIGSNAFMDCGIEQETLILPPSLRSLGKNAFNGVKFSNLYFLCDANIRDSFNWSELTGTLKIGGAKKNISSSDFGTLYFSELILEEGVESIDDRTFYRCQDFKGSIVIPNSVKTIGAEAFLDCNNFTGDLILGDGVTTVGDKAFQGCISLSGNISFGSNLESIGKEAFYYLRNLSGELPSFENLKTIGEAAFANCEHLTGSIYLPKIEKIGKKAFYYCRRLDGNLTLGENLTSIPESAFEQCSSLTGSIIIPDKVYYIDDKAFYDCVSLDGSLVLGKGLSSIGMYAFQHCSGLTGNLILPESLKTIWNGAFSGCSGFTGSLTIPDGVITIWNSAFSGCKNLSGSLKIGGSVESIKLNAFWGCEGFKIVELPASLDELGATLFMDCNFSTLVSLNPEPPISSGGSVQVFTDDNYKASLYVPDEAVDKYKKNSLWNKFAGIYPLSELNVVECTGVTIDPVALELEEGNTAELTATLEPADTFFDNLVWTTSDKTVAEVDPYGVVKAIRVGEAEITVTTANGLQATCAITVIPPRPQEFTIDGIKYERRQVTNSGITQWEVFVVDGEPDENGAIIIPNSIYVEPHNFDVSAIDPAAFKGREDITKLSIPWKIAQISDEAFADCKNLKEVIVEDVGNIPEASRVCLYFGKDVFLNSPIETVYIGHPVSGNAFAGHSSLKELTFGSNIQEIVAEEFAGCYDIQQIKSMGNRPPVLDPRAFDSEVYGKVAPRVPDGYVDNYRKAQGWKDFYEVLGFEEIRPEGLEIVPSEITLSVGDMRVLDAIFTPENTTNKTLTWTTSDDDIAPLVWGSGNVGNGGMVAGNVGTAVITATTWNGIKATCTVKVVNAGIPLEGLELDITEADIIVGENLKLKAIFTPAEATDVHLSWSSSDESVAEVDAAGNIKAIAVGTATITVKSGDGFTASCLIRVHSEDEIIAEGIELNMPMVEITEGDTVELIATITPAETTDKTVTWSSSDPEIATVDQNGIVTAVKVGKATITAKLTNGLEVTCQVTVVAKVIEAEGIELNLPAVEVIEGETVELTATVNPEETTDKTVTWTSSDETVATVDQNGIVTALKVGKATITARTANGFEATCLVTVDTKMGINGIDDDTQISVKVQAGVILVNAPEGLEVEVYSMNGVRMAKTREYYIEGLANGIYTVRIGGKVFKVMI